MTEQLPIDKWIQEAEESQERFPDEPERKKYEDKLVAWLDILGMRNLIRTSKEPEEVFPVMEKLLYFVQNLCDDLFAQNKLNYLQISDGFIIAADLSCIDEICDILCRIQWQALVYTKMQLRGALTAGKISMSDDSKLILGPAFIEAFSLESENAIFPRIIYSEKLDEYIDRDKTTFSHLRIDSDNLRYLDYIGYIIAEEKLSYKEIKHLLETEGILNILKLGYTKSQKESIRVAQKYGWTISKFESRKVKILS